MKYLSVCSGIEAASVAWSQYGFEAVGFAEIDKFASQVLANRFPNTPNYGDITKHAEWPIKPGSIDILVGGTPCQSFSVAGLRKGLSDPRGNLSLVFLGIADRLRPRWIVWENVPGFLSADGGRCAGSFFGALSQLGYGWAYRILDAAHFGVAQRRKRVFVVGYLGDPSFAGKVLFEPESLPGNNQKSNEEKQENAQTSVGCTDGKSRFSIFGRNNQRGEINTAGCLNAHHSHRDDFATETFIIDKNAFNQGENAKYDPVIRKDDKMQTLVHTRYHAVAYRKSRRAQSESHPETWVNDEKSNTLNVFDVGENRDTHAVITFQVGNLLRNAGAKPSDKVTTLKSSFGDQKPCVATPMVIRRLTPIECERLQGFPDNWTQIPWNGKPAEECPDGHRYRACGNSMAVPVMSWIGKRIKQVNDETHPS